MKERLVWVLDIGIGLVAIAAMWLIGTLAPQELERMEDGE